ncbi:hypothetical protein BDY21DRAFT_14072 [Lineolata rhizophorae]|uniref:Uncharacterized protein n=1 Tax=Lineolata rhizophorae TaxID=578093 RepID=A0A6A6PF82_9PEZI|nr:hypothetical protein BDY21DRAFT_14072 [Lineolata rhizophorae]
MLAARVRIGQVACAAEPDKRTVEGGEQPGAPVHLDATAANTSAAAALGRTVFLAPPAHLLASWRRRTEPAAGQRAALRPLPAILPRQRPIVSRLGPNPPGHCPGWGKQNRVDAKAPRPRTWRVPCDDAVQSIATSLARHGKVVVGGPRARPIFWERLREGESSPRDAGPVALAPG